MQGHFNYGLFQSTQYGERAALFPRPPPWSPTFLIFVFPLSSLLFLLAFFCLSAGTPFFLSFTPPFWAFFVFPVSAPLPFFAYSILRTSAFASRNQNLGFLQVEPQLRSGVVPDPHPVLAGIMEADPVDACFAGSS